MSLINSFLYSRHDFFLLLFGADDHKSFWPIIKAAKPNTGGSITEYQKDK